MKILIRQVAEFCRDHPACWTPLLLGAAIAVGLNVVSEHGRHLILRWAGTGQSVLGGSSPLSEDASAPRALFASTLFQTAINLTLVLVMSMAFVAMARLAEREMIDAEHHLPAGELMRALTRQLRGIAWFSLQYSVCSFAVTLIGSFVFSYTGVAQLFAMTFHRTSPARWAASLIETGAVSYMLAVPALRLIAPGEEAGKLQESAARKLVLWYAAGSAALGWCWDLVRFNVHVAPAVSRASEFVATVVMNVPLLMLAVSFVVITAPAPEAEPTEMSPAT